MDNDLCEQLTQLAVEFRINVQRKSERPTKPLPVVPTLERGGRATKEIQPSLSHINAQGSTSNGGILKELSTANEASDVVEEATPPLKHTATPERELVVSLLPRQTSYGLCKD